jgi:DNA repair protein RadD
MLRPYQQRTITMLYDWLRDNDGNPCLVLPTGAGKSHIIAELCRDAIQSWPDTRIVMLTHQKELIEQNAAKLRQVWPGAPMGIYSASIGRRELGEPITFAGIQSVRKRARQIGYVDLALVDEAHLISHKDEGGYRTLLAELSAINPSLRVIGLTATPYRLGHGLITDKPAIFDALIEPVSILELVDGGFLSPLRSKVTREQLSVEGVHKRGGEYIEKELQAAVDTADQNAAVVAEVIALAGDRRSWLFFCVGVDHSYNIRNLLRERGISTEAITGTTPKAERERIIRDFRAGHIRALTNCSVLTTGFDAPDIDLIAMLRPTLSPSLYVQMAGRGMRLKSHTDHCLVLDFAGVVAKHGPITCVEPPSKAGTGDAPVKACPDCGELIHLSVMLCPACGHEFPQVEKPPPELRRDDIMGLEGTDMAVTKWRWRKHTSRTSGKDMLAVTYYGELSDPPITEYLPVTHDGVAGQRALAALALIAGHAQARDALALQELQEVAKALTDGLPPSDIEYRKDGKFYRVIRREWNATTPEARAREDMGNGRARVLPHL